IPVTPSMKTSCLVGAAALVAAALWSAPLRAVRLPLRTLTTADGLPRDQLACVVNDARGFVWFCTAEGLVRFDGPAAGTFGGEEGLESPGVRSFLSARDGRLWIGTDAGLVEFVPDAADATGRFRRAARTDRQPTGAINAVHQSPAGVIWCASGRGLL